MAEGNLRLGMMAHLLLEELLKQMILQRRLSAKVVLVVVDSPSRILVACCTLVAVVEAVDCTVRIERQVIGSSERAVVALDGETLPPQGYHHHHHHYHLIRERSSGR